MFNRAVTIFRKTKDGCEKSIIQDVFYTDTRGLSIENKGESDAYSIKIVIPLRNLPKELEIRTGDFACKDVVQSEYADITSLIQSEPAFEIISCDMKDYGNNPHLLILGR